MKVLHFCLSILIISLLQAKNPDSTKVDKNYLLGKNEVYVSYGFLSVSGLGIGLSRTSFNQDFPYGYASNKDKYNTTSKEIPPAIGALNFGYKRYFVKNKIAVLLDVTFSQINTTYKHKTTDSLNFKTKDYMVAIMPGFEYHYFNRKIVQLYSGVQFGFFIFNQKYIDTRSELKHKQISFAFQVDALGIRVGKQIAGFAELGFGFGGTAKIGISGRF